MFIFTIKSSFQELSDVASPPVHRLAMAALMGTDAVWLMLCALTCGVGEIPLIRCTAQKAHNQPLR
jgi:hypothetical protein